MQRKKQGRENGSTKRMILAVLLAGMLQGSVVITASEADFVTEETILQTGEQQEQTTPQPEQTQSQQVQQPQESPQQTKQPQERVQNQQVQSQQKKQSREKENASQSGQKSSQTHDEQQETVSGQNESAGKQDFRTPPRAINEEKERESVNDTAKLPPEKQVEETEKMKTDSGENLIVESKSMAHGQGLFWEMLLFCSGIFAMGAYRLYRSIKVVK